MYGSDYDSWKTDEDYGKRIRPGRMRRDPDDDPRDWPDDDYMEQWPDDPEPLPEPPPVAGTWREGL